MDLNNSYLFHCKKVTFSNWEQIITRDDLKFENSYFITVEYTIYSHNIWNFSTGFMYNIVEALVFSRFTTEQYCTAVYN